MKEQPTLPFNHDADLISDAIGLSREDLERFEDDKKSADAFVMAFLKNEPFDPKYLRYLELSTSIDLGVMASSAISQEIQGFEMFDDQIKTLWPAFMADGVTKTSKIVESFERKIILAIRAMRKSMKDKEQSVKLDQASLIALSLMFPFEKNVALAIADVGMMLQEAVDDKTQH
jgi:hypothetical protein